MLGDRRTKALTNGALVLAVVASILTGSLLGLYVSNEFAMRSVTTTESITSSITSTETSTMTLIRAVSTTTDSFVTKINVSVNDSLGKNYSISLWASDPRTSIINVTVKQSNSNPGQLIQFYFTNMSFLFASPSFSLVPNNCTTLYTAFRNGTVIPSFVNATENVLISSQRLNGWIEIDSSPCELG